MTGFGRARGPLGPEWTADLTARSVNHRFLDLTVRLRESDAPLEPMLRRVFSRHLARGKVEVTGRLLRHGPAGSTVIVDEGLLEALLARVSELARKYPLRGALELSDLFAVPQIFTIEGATAELTDDETRALEALAEQVAGGLVAMREAEGNQIAAELLGRIDLLEAKRRQLELRRDEIVRSTAETLRERVRSLFPDLPIDSGRLEQEAALAAERSDVSEELQRLRGHLEQFRGLLSGSSGAVGKKLDFLSQEILREINTLGSKARDLQLVREVLDMKSETEKIREQVQNIE